jgi:nucleolar protein 14
LSLCRRFGEADADLSLEDKMFLRFQKERMKRVRNNSSLFNLSDEVVLTHKGQALGDANYADNDEFSDDDKEEDVGSGGLNKQMVDSLHFGGGLVQANRVDTKMNRLDALQEIVMKSKLAKLQKKETKLAQEEERESLDKAFRELIGDNEVEFRPMKRERRSRDDADNDEEGNDDYGYNMTLQSMTTEVKTKPSDRTKSDEEIAVENKARLEQLEKERLKRMKGTRGGDADLEGGAGPKSKRAKGERMNDDYMDDSMGAKSKKVHAAQRRMGGDDDDFGETEVDDEDENELDDEEWEEDDMDDDGNENEEGDEEEEDDEEGDGEEDEEEDDDEEEEEEDEDEGDENDDEDDISYDEEDEADEEGDEVAEYDDNDKEILNRSNKRKHGFDPLDVMPHRIECPADTLEFYDLIEKYTRRPEDVSELITRIVTWHSVHLPGAEGAQNRVVVHNFLDILMKHFVRVGDTLPFSSSSDDLKTLLDQLDHLCRTIFQLSTDISDAVGPLWGRTVKIFLSQLQKKLRDYVPSTVQKQTNGDKSAIDGSVTTCWPSLGRLLLLRQAGHVFAVTDYRHSVVGPVTLFLCQCLSQCPVVSVADVASGLLCVSILIDFCKGSEKVIPECFTFLRSVLQLFSMTQSDIADIDRRTDILGNTNEYDNAMEAARLMLATRSNSTRMQSTFDPVALRALRPTACRSADDAENLDKKIPWSAFDRKPEMVSEEMEARHCLCILQTAYSLIEKLHGKVKPLDGYPELMDPVLSSLQGMRPQVQPTLPTAILAAHVTLSESIAAHYSHAKATRKPLMWRKPKLFMIESKNPRYQVDYKMKKDTDPDSERVMFSQLTRYKKRHDKAAMRELRRDSNVVEQEKFKEKRAALDSQRQERYKNFSWMEDQQATVNQQVRKGKSLLKGGGSGINKKARVKR